MAEFEPYSFEYMRDFSDCDGENTNSYKYIQLTARTSLEGGRIPLGVIDRNYWHCKNWENQQERESMFVAKRLAEP